MNSLYPNFIQAQTLTGLRSLMATVSLRRGGTVTFFSVYFDGKNHVAWYHDTLENLQAEQKAQINQAKG